MNSKSEINPILLEKSDDLIKAEIQLQRQRLERALREQIEQQRLAAKALLQTSESLPNFDIGEVLQKALTIVHPSTSAEVEPSVDASASDSFDENTFYSSQHDTPEPSVQSSSSQSHKDSHIESVNAQSHGLVSVDKRPVEIYSTKSQTGHQDVVMTGASLSNDNHLAAQAHSQTQHSSLQQARQVVIEEQPSQMAKPDATGVPSRANDQHLEQFRVSTSIPLWTTQNIAAYQKVDQLQASTGRQIQEAFENDTASPLVRAHNLSPLAPQPARVSPLATRDPPILREPIQTEEAQPAQVAALRQKPSGLSSTDSSPKDLKAIERKRAKKEKKKKWKASNNGNTATPDSPYIKPEPRSPSPFAVAPLPRPQKRQRQMGQYAAELNYDEPRYEPSEAQERIPEQYKEVPVARVYDRYEDRYECAPEPRRPEPVYQRVEREEGDYRRISGGQYVRRPDSPGVYALPPPPSEARIVRAPPHAIVDRRYHEEPVYYRDPVPRASVRPDADHERSRSPVLRERRSPIPMGPPRRPVRIIIDEYGREYIDPTPVPPVRQSMAPQNRYREGDVVYERAPLRTVSARAPVGAYEEDGVVYRTSSPTAAAPQRVITQPEYVIPPEYRQYREREYSVRPSATAPPREEYIQIRGAPERRQMSHFEEAPREYIPRAPSVRPEPVRYEIPREYVGRMQSARPEGPPREYAASARPEPHREMMPPISQPEYSVRPVDSIPRREHIIVSDSDRYYEEAPSRRPAAEVAFIERPRAREASVMVYADDVRREVYR